MRILVTGGAGYVGSVSVERLVAAGHDVVVLDDLSTGHRAAADGVAPRARRPTPMDPRPPTLLDRERIEAILHCAARSLVAESIADPARYYRENVAGGVALLEAARTAGVRRIVFSSTAAVYGAPDAMPINEDAPLDPINPYGETKRTFEGALDWYGRAYGLRSVALRYFNVAGASERNGEQHDSRDAPHPERPRGGRGRPAIDRVRDRLPDRRTARTSATTSTSSDLADAHLAALEATAPDDRRTDAAGAPGDAARPVRSPSTSAARPGSASARSSPRPSASSGDRSRSTVGPRRAGRSAGPRGGQRPGPRRSSAGRRGAARSTR